MVAGEGCRRGLTRIGDAGRRALPDFRWRRDPPPRLAWEVRRPACSVDQGLADQRPEFLGLTDKGKRLVLDHEDASVIPYVEIS